MNSTSIFTELLTSSDNLKFVFASRVLLCIVLCLVKVSNALLVLEIFTKSMNGMMLWFYIIVGATLAQALIGPLILSAGCSPTQVLAADPHALCSSNVRSKKNEPLSVASH